MVKKILEKSGRIKSGATAGSAGLATILTSVGIWLAGEVGMPPEIGAAIGAWLGGSMINNHSDVL